MADRSSRDTGRDYDREWRGTRQVGHREERRDGHRPTEREHYGEERSDNSCERGYSSGDYRRRGPPACFECGQVGHYRNQCWKLTGARTSKQGEERGPGIKEGREASPAKEALMKKVENLGSSLATMQEFFAKENKKREEKEQRKKNKLLKKQREQEEEEARRSEEAARQEKQRRKIAKLREAEEAKQQLRKELRMEVAMAVGGLEEEVCGRVLQTVVQTAMLQKGKQKVDLDHGTTGKSASDTEDSEVERINMQTRRMAISEKRKRSTEKAIGDSPPMEQHPKHTPKTPNLRPVQLSSRLQKATGKKTEKTPKKFTPRQGTPKTKIAAMIGVAGRVKFVRENVCQLSELQADELKEICKKEEVDYVNKTIAAMNIAEKWAAEAYDSTQVEVANTLTTAVESTNLESFEDNNEASGSEEDSTQGEEEIA
ncbi:hypothetical protein CBR_g55487 [Chara braunii]|uniref:CCHC-type domain-containing protein n=1 Tax=Chara braunii TaxID=69332 RepID=A0A388MD12_CHABU|nr:hypothetical protein CBR_g55487 [Chara braunii]|eukprot:GBG92450.1 hypothetical protein CBR_g55487 [Chara braunii]